MLTKDKLDSVLSYDRETGEFHWKCGGKGRRADLKAGTVTNHGYVVIMLEGHRYVAHQLAWLTVYAVWPSLELDHKDRIKTNNRINNLREVTHSVNVANTGTRADNVYGRGVCWDSQKGKWKVQVGPATQRVQKHFTDLSEAQAFAKVKIAEIFGATV